MSDDTRIFSRVKTLTRREVEAHPSDLIAITRAQVEEEVREATYGMETIPPIWTGSWWDGDRVHVAAKVAVPKVEKQGRGAGIPRGR